MHASQPVTLSAESTRSMKDTFLFPLLLQTPQKLNVRWLYPPPAQNSTSYAGCVDLYTLHVLSLHQAYVPKLVLMNYSSLEFGLLPIHPLFDSEEHRWLHYSPQLRLWRAWIHVIPIWDQVNWLTGNIRLCTQPLVPEGQKWNTS